MSEVYELQKRIDGLILQVSTIKEIPIQPAIPTSQTALLAHLTLFMVYLHLMQ